MMTAHIEHIEHNPSAPKPFWRPSTILGGMFLILFGFILVAELTGSLNGGGASKSGAEVACQNFVEARLKSPGTADFSGTDAFGTGDMWTVSGAVDSQNSFGGVVRTTYTCNVTHTTGDRWQLDSLTLH
jgi:hypothetical protein